MWILSRATFTQYIDYIEKDGTGDGFLRFMQLAALISLVCFKGSFTINNVTPNNEGEASKVKVKVRVNIHGAFSVTQASLVEKVSLSSTSFYAALVG